MDSRKDSSTLTKVSKKINAVRLYEQMTKHLGGFEMGEHCLTEFLWDLRLVPTHSQPRSASTQLHFNNN